MSLSLLDNLIAELYLLRSEILSLRPLIIKSARTAFFILVVALIPITTVSASQVTVDDGEIADGKTIALDLTLDSVPDGLSGYNITINLSNGSVAEIESATYPNWAALNDNSSFPSDSVWIKAVDLQDQIGRSDKNISLVVLAIRGESSGTTAIDLIINKMNDDNGDTIIPSTDNGTLTVTTTETKSEKTSSSGGGSIGGLLPTPTPTPSSTPVATPSIAEEASTPIVTQTTKTTSATATKTTTTAVPTITTTTVKTNVPEKKDTGWWQQPTETIAFSLIALAVVVVLIYGMKRK